MTEGEGVRVEMTRFASGGMTEECDFPSAMWAGLAKKMVSIHQAAEFQGVWSHD